MRLTGRFAPSPSGEMHLGNLSTALISYLSVKSRGGRWILRHEDIDTQRCKLAYALRIEDDLKWLGLHWDEGGVDSRGPNGPYMQSLRSDIYYGALERLAASGLLYRCTCTRADLRASSAPHRSDGFIIYGGRCRPRCMPQSEEEVAALIRHLDDKGRGALRLCVPDRRYAFRDLAQGDCRLDLCGCCGDFVVRRSDGGWAYQLAVAVDDALMGVTEVVRGCDLLDSVAPQSFIRDLLGWPHPEYAHIPLWVGDDGSRLSKRDRSVSMGLLRDKYTPEGLLGQIAFSTGMRPDPSPVSLASLTETFSWQRLSKTESPRHTEPGALGL